MKSAWLVTLGVSFAFLVPASYAQLPPFDTINDEPAALPENNTALNSGGVDQFSGSYGMSFELARIGDPGGQGGLSYSRSFSNLSWRNNLGGGVYESSTTGRFTVRYGNFTEEFTLTNPSLGTYAPWRPTVSTLEEDVSGGSWGDFTYKASDGSVIEFSGDLRDTSIGLHAAITSVTRPNGEVITYDGPNVSSSLGYQLRTEDGNSLINSAYKYCDVTLDNCSGLPSGNWPSASGLTNSAGETYSVTDTAVGNNTQIQVTSPEGVSTTVTLDSNGRVSSRAYAGNTWTYSSSSTSSQTQSTVTGPSGISQVSTYNSDGQILSAETIPSGQTSGLGVTYTYKDGLPETVTYPEGNSVVYKFDPLGRLEEIREKAKPSSGVPDRVVSFTYAACGPTTYKYCSKPITVTNERGLITKYSYSSAHGEVIRIEHPRPNSSADYPIQTFGYVQKYAWVKASSGTSQVQASAPVWRLVQSLRCSVPSQTDNCVGNSSAIEVTDYAYEAGNSSTPSNVLLKSVTRRSVDYSIIATTAYTYDTWGRVTKVDGPLAGDDDSSWYEYDHMGRVTLTTGPDPDASGGMQHSYAAISYNDDGQTIEQESGSVNAPSGSRSFSPISVATQFYDTYGRQQKTQLVDSSSAVISVSQVSYDSVGRPECAALRMSPTSYSSLPASACTQSGAGIDRITKTFYDSYGRPWKATSAFGTSAARDQSVSYTDNGQVETITDGRGARTTYEYDGLDRLVKTRYPDPSSSGASSTTDFELVTYWVDNGLSTSDVHTAKNRNGETFGFAYDNLGRIADISRPSGLSALSYTYDGLGHQTSVTSGGTTLSYGWDVLGRMTSEQSAIGTVSYQYDSGGRRTRMTWPDSVYITYEYLAGSSALTTIRENGSTPLASFTYDSQGRRSALGYGNGVTTTYGYDDASRLSDLNISVPNDTDYSVEYDYTYNASGQIVQRQVSNFSYADQLPASGHSYAYDMQSKLTSTDSQSVTHDARGNLTNDGNQSYAYDAENRLTSVNSGTSLSYDPAGRLTTVSDTANTKMLYDGVQLIGEYDNGGNLLRRYVHGPSLDEPLVWYEGSGVSSSTRRYMSADERGSVTLLSAASGTSIGLNQFSVFGEPSANNAGRFGYTGQAWIQEASLHHYRARAYSASLGRFLQPDPIGYGDGLNMYAYVGNDPVSLIDPTGTFGEDPPGNPDPKDDGCPYSYTCDDVELAAWLKSVDSFVYYWVLGWSNESPVEAAPAGVGTCSTAPLSGPEAWFAVNGWRAHFWESRARAGDRWADAAIKTAFNSGSPLAGYANWRLVQELSIRNGDYEWNMNAGPMRRKLTGDYEMYAGEIKRISVEIMREHAHRLTLKSGITGQLTNIQFGNYHGDVFERFGLPRSTYGAGTPNITKHYGPMVLGLTSC
ncbi:RHS repeat domain-containing protein [Henriciella algicola]|nr:RHS repeat-associated core domain-containing protein [Henriciella algicola]